MAESSHNSARTYHDRGETPEEHSGQSVNNGNGNTPDASSLGAPFQTYGWYATLRNVSSNSSRTIQRHNGFFIFFLLPTVNTMKYSFRLMPFNLAHPVFIFPWRSTERTPIPSKSIRAVGVSLGNSLQTWPSMSDNENFNVAFKNEQGSRSNIP